MWNTEKTYYHHTFVLLKDAYILFFQVFYLPIKNNEGDTLLEKQDDGSHKVVSEIGVAYRTEKVWTKRTESPPGPDFDEFVFGEIEEASGDKYWLKVELFVQSNNCTGCH